MNEYQRYLIEEFADDYREREMSRRDLLKRAVLVMGSIPAGLSALAAVGCGGDDDEDTAEATQALASPSPGTASASPASPSAQPGGAIRTSDIRFTGPASELLGYLAQPAATAPSPGIVVIHENRGLVEHIKDVARRYASEGFTALAVDLVSRQGGSEADTAANTGALGNAKVEDLVADMTAYVNHLKAMEGVKPGGVGVTGFCFGGGYTFETAVATDVKAAVPYYGTARNVMSRLATTQAAVLAIYGGNDARITGESENVRSELAKTGKPYDIQVYAGANHAFFNDTGTNYNADAARDAWTKTLAWFRQYV